MNHLSKTFNGNFSAIESCDIDGSTPLALAVANGHRELARILIENGAGLDTADKLGMTPIFRAVKFNYTVINVFHTRCDYLFLVSTTVYLKFFFAFILSRGGP